MKEYILNFIKYQLHEHCGRSIGVILGFIISLAILIFGLFTTLLDRKSTRLNSSHQD